MTSSTYTFYQKIAGQSVIDYIFFRNLFMANVWNDYLLFHHTEILQKPWIGIWGHLTKTKSIYIVLHLQPYCHLFMKRDAGRSLLPDNTLPNRRIHICSNVFSKETSYLITSFACRSSNKILNKKHVQNCISPWSTQTQRKFTANWLLGMGAKLHVVLEHLHCCNCSKK